MTSLISFWIVQGTPLEFLLQRKADVLLDYSYKIRVPPEFQRDPELTADWLTDQMVAVYQCSEDRNCLHFIQVYSLKK